MILAVLILDGDVKAPELISHRIYSYTKNNSLWKPAEWLLHVKQGEKKKKPTRIEKGRKGCPSYHHMPHPAQWPTIGGELTTQFLPEKKSLWAQHLASQLLRLPPEGWAPETPSSESQWGLCPWTHKITANEEAVFNRLIKTHQGYLHSAEHRKIRLNMSLSLFPKEIYLHIFKKLQPEGQAPNLAHI